MRYDEDDDTEIDPTKDDTFSVKRIRGSLEFDSDDPEFLRGLDLGLLWQAIFFEIPVLRQVFVSNTENIMRLAEYYDMEFTAEPVEGDSDMVLLSMAPKSILDE